MSMPVEASEWFGSSAWRLIDLLIGIMVGIVLASNRLFVFSCNSAK
jgi:hypothetical protein